MSSNSTDTVSLDELLVAINDLRRMGFSALDIIEQSDCDPQFLIEVFKAADLPIVNRRRIGENAGTTGNLLAVLDLAAQPDGQQLPTSPPAPTPTPAPHPQVIAEQLPAPHTISPPDFYNNRWLNNMQILLSDGEEEDEDKSHRKTSGIPQETATTRVTTPPTKPAPSIRLLKAQITTLTGMLAETAKTQNILQETIEMKRRELHEHETTLARHKSKHIDLAKRLEDAKKQLELRLKPSAVSSLALPAVVPEKDVEPMQPYLEHAQSIPSSPLVPHPPDYDRDSDVEDETDDNIPLASLASKSVSARTARFKKVALSFPLVSGQSRAESNSPTTSSLNGTTVSTSSLSNASRKRIRVKNEHNELPKKKKKVGKCITAASKKFNDSHSVSRLNTPDVSRSTISTTKKELTTPEQEEKQFKIGGTSTRPRIISGLPSASSELRFLGSHNMPLSFNDSQPTSSSEEESEDPEDKDWESIFMDNDESTESSNTASTSSSGTPSSACINGTTSISGSQGTTSTNEDALIGLRGSPAPLIADNNEVPLEAGLAALAGGYGIDLTTGRKVSTERYKDLINSEFERCKQITDYEFKCFKCHRVLTKSSMKPHIQGHYNIAMYFCRGCGKGDKRKQNTTAHEKRCDKFRDYLEEEKRQKQLTKQQKQQGGTMVTAQDYKESAKYDDDSTIGEQNGTVNKKGDSIAAVPHDNQEKAPNETESDAHPHLKVRNNNGVGPEEGTLSATPSTVSEDGSSSISSSKDASSSTDDHNKEDNSSKPTTTLLSLDPSSKPVSSNQPLTSEESMVTNICELRSANINEVPVGNLQDQICQEPDTIIEEGVMGEAPINLKCERFYIDEDEPLYNSKQDILESFDIFLTTPQIFTEFKYSLKGFKSYRFHYGFDTSELDSVTFSNDIDLENVFCLNELVDDDGCHSERCPYQHLKDIALKGNVIIMNISNDIPACNPLDHKMKFTELCRFLKEKCDDEKDLKKSYDIIKNYRMGVLKQNAFLNLDSS